MQRKVFIKNLQARTTQTTQQTQAAQGGLIKDWTIDLPKIAIPRAVQKVLGSKAGKLSLDGTQKISFQVSSTKRKRVPIYETSNKSTFDLKMEQETNLRLSGTIGEKISVNLKYNSKQDDQFFDPNNVNVKYTGTEDEIIQIIEAGNISLSLSGSRYISYSTSSQGLFGITSKWKYGDLELTMIASKEEGKKNTQTYIGQSQADSVVFRSKDYTARTMYFINDPYQLFRIYDGFNATDDDPIPPQGIGNAIVRDNFGLWIQSDPNLFPENGTVEIWFDDGISTNNTAITIPGVDIPDGNDILYTPYYEKLIEGTDYLTDYTSGIVQILKQVERRATIAVIYTNKAGNTVPPDAGIQNDILHCKVIRRRNQEYYPYNAADPNDVDNVWHYQLRNVYNLNRTNIKNDGFALEVYNENVDRTRNYNLPDTLVSTGFSTYNDFLRIDSNRDGLINGDDTTVNLSSGLVVFPYLNPFLPLGDILPYQEENENVSFQDITMFISAKGKVGRDAIDLAQGGLLRGSVRVKVNGADQRENIDYIVDYDFGRITFLTPAGKDPDAKIEIDYEFRSMFDVARKSLAGMRADWNISENAKLGGTLIYRSESVNERRPKIGNENIEMWLADIDGNISFKPKFITNWIDALPLISTSAESRIALSGEIAMTAPNIYGDPEGKKKIAYLDDMEAIVDQYPLGTTFSSWVLGSKPWESNLARGKTHWFHKNVLRETIEDPATLTEREGKENVTVLAIKVLPSNLGVPGSEVRSWGGILKYLGNQLDFSSKKYIELLVKVDVPSGTPVPDAVLKIDLGDINEDFYTEFGGYKVLNTEDKDQDGVLTIEEDVGLDGIKSDQPGADPNDIASDVQTNGEYLSINGTEDNRILDTEDLDGNGTLNELDRYFSYAIALNGNQFLENENPDNWRLYRIPIADPSVYQIVNNSGSGAPPNLKRISYARIRIETDTTTKVLIADAAVVGNKWQDFFVRNINIPVPPNTHDIVPDTELTQNGTSYISGIVNNQKNFSHYVSPEGTYYIEDGKESSESSLTLSVQNLMPDQYVLLRQRMIESYNLLSYDKLKFWIYPEAAPERVHNPDTLDIVFRIGSDSLNYYQIRQRVQTLPYYSTGMQRNQWMEFTFPLREITFLKQFSTGTAVADTTIGNTNYSIRGNPTLTNVREYCFGVLNAAPDPSTANEAKSNSPYSGTIYFNDLRVADPYEEIGWAKRLTLNTSLADFITFDADFEQKTESFNPTIERGRQNSYTETTSINLTNKYFLNKFFPNSWSLDIPVNLNRNYSIGTPRYRANSDLLRDSITDSEEKDREKNENLVYAADFGFSQRTAPKNKLLFYTIHRTALSGRVEQAYRLSPTTRDTTLTWRGTLNYNLGFPSDKSSFTIWKNYKFTYLPSTFNNSFQVSSIEPKAYNWEKRTNETGWFPRAQTLRSKTLTSDNNLTWNFTNDIATTIRLNTKRDLLQRDSLFSINIGKQTEYVQDLGLNYNPAYFPRIMNLTTSTTSKYTEYQRKYTQNLSEGYIDVYQKDGNSARTFRANLGLMNSTLFSSWAEKIATNHRNKKGTASSAPADPPRDGQEPKDPKPKDEMSEEEMKKIQDQLSKEELEKYGLESKEPEKEPEFPETKEEDGKDPNYDPAKDLYPPKDGDPDAKDGKESEDGDVQSPPRDFYLPAALIGYLAKFKNINASFQNSYTQVYTRKEDRPTFAFQLGLPHSVDRDFLDSIADDNTITLSSGITFSKNLDSNLNYSYSNNKRYSNASQQTLSRTFPDVTLTLSDVDQWLGITKFLASARLNTGFQYNVRQTGDINWKKPQQETISKTFNPLLGITTNIMNAVSTNISMTMTQSENITDMNTYSIVRTTDTKGLNSNFSYSYRAGKGFRIPFTEKRIHIRNELTSSLALQYEVNYDITKGRDSSVVDRHTTRLAVTPGATYQFNADIKGGLTGSYEVNSDKKRDDGSTIFRLGIWAEVTL